jgi:hypothetical protein
VHLVDKVFFNPALTDKTPPEQSFEQIVSRFEQFLKNTKRGTDCDQFGLLIHENKEEFLFNEIFKTAERSYPNADAWPAGSREPGDSR